MIPDRRWLLLYLLVFPVIAACTGGRSATAGRSSTASLAITVDDLPWVGQVGPGDSSLLATGRLLSAFTSRGVPASGFVNCGKIERHPGVLQAWRAAKLELGNHGHSHLDLNKEDVEVWLEDARRCHAIMLEKVQPGQPVRFFRYPFLHQGATLEARQHAAEGLAALGYRNAHVTVDNLDYVIAAAYGKAAALGDREEQHRLGGLYREHLLTAVEQFERVAEEAVGRPVAQVLLLHANLVAADHLGTVLDALARRGVRFVALEAALADPVYVESDGYVGPRGLSWLYRVRPELLSRWGPIEDEREAALARSLAPR